MDIDIDFPNRDIILSKLTHHVAALETGKKHNTGIYVTPVPHNPLDNVATIDYKTADQRGYFKLDFLNVNIYKDVKNEEHLTELLNREPLWELLQHNEMVDQLFHVSGHGDILRTLKPTNIEELACALAIIRPAKRYLLNESWTKIKSEVWTKPANDQYYFKKAHAVSYAAAVVVHLNLLCENII
jgi:DNA polymerase III alpha subunit